MLTNKNALFVAGVALLIFLPPLARVVLTRFRMTRKNYRGDEIPTAFGVVILVWSSGAFIGLMSLMPAVRRETAAYLAVVAGLGLLGFIDDLWGNRSTSGLRGHIRAAAGGRITTGFLKAAGAPIVSICVSRFLLGREWPDAILDGAIISLAANAVNLLDLRPGRAGAGFILAAVALIVYDYRAGHWPSPLVFVLIPALVVYERDARGAVMMGDTGSNLLGGALGIAAAVAFPGTAPRLVILAFLIAVHLLAERWSLTKIIERTPILRRLDALTGRR